MAETVKKNRLKLLIIFALSVIPFLLAVVMGGKASFIKGKVNNGELISPLITTEDADFIGLDPFSKDNLKELKGHWVLLNIVPKAFCNSDCVNAMYKTKQLRLMMNKDLTRIRRAVLFAGEVRLEEVAVWTKDDPVLLKLKPSAVLLGKIGALRNGELPDGLLLLMDPLGNVMMQYKPGFDPYKVKSDLAHLLRVSQIG